MHRTVNRAQVLTVLTKPCLYAGERAAEPFITDESLQAAAECGAGPFLQIWSNHKTLVLGVRDAQLPGASVAVEHFRKTGWDLLVRSSGGALVPLDAGVVNLSFIYQHPVGFLGIDEDFRWLAQRLTDLFALFVPRDAIEVGEVHGSYCPGRFDISISGQKICGISQRRSARATLLHAFINVLDDGGARAQVAASFYQLAANGEPPAIHLESARIGSLQGASGHVSKAQLTHALLEICNDRFASLQPASEGLAVALAAHASGFKTKTL